MTQALYILNASLGVTRCVRGFPRVPVTVPRRDGEMKIRIIQEGIQLGQPTGS